MKLVFMGSPAFAVPCLRALVDGGHEVVLVVSQPDKPAGRGGQLHAPAVKTAALELGLPIAQPASARKGELRDAIKRSGAELCVVVAYGKILPKDVLEAAPRGCINVHGSLLPKYRGAAPIQWAVIDGEAETGVSIMQLDEGMDTGPVYLERRTAIGETETSGALMERLAPIGAAALLEGIAAIAGGATPVPQDHARATHARMLEKVDGAIDFAREARLVAARINGVDPWPGAYAMRGTEPIKLFRASVAVGANAPGLLDVIPLDVPERGAHPAGTVVAVDTRGLVVACADGAVAISDVQAPNRKRMAAAQFAAGRGIAVGDVLT